MREWTKETFHSAYETYSTMVYRLCMLYLKNESDAKDALQDIFLKIWEKKPVFQNEMHCRAWLIQTTKHHCLDLLKSSWFKKRVAYDHNIRNPMYSGNQSADNHECRKSDCQNRNDSFHCNA